MQRRGWWVMVERAIGEECYDTIRALVSAFCWREERTLVPTSTLAIQHELNRRNHQWSASDLLDELAEVRDVQRVDRGYWLPSPTHLAVSLEFALVVSGLPNQELQREIGLIPDYAGVGRVIRSVEARPAAIPAISLNEWIGAPTSTKDWTEGLVRRARYAAPFGMAGVEVFRNWKMSSPTRWMRLDDIRLPQEAVVLGRHQWPNRRTNYYLFRVCDRRVAEMHELSAAGDDVLRLMCGLRAIGEDPVICRVRRKSGAFVWHLHVEMLPRSERRLLGALGRVVEQESVRGLEAAVPEFALACITKVCESLGCKVEGARHD